VVCAAPAKITPTPALASGLFVHELDCLHEGGGRDPEQACVGLAEFEDEEDRECNDNPPNASAEITSVLDSA
jgi:hypothetical protein